MQRRWQRSALSLLCVTGAYAVYALIAVPLIEPRVVYSARTSTTVFDSRPTSIDHLFAPGDWELEHPKILETEQGTLLFDEYTPIENRRKLQLNRCTFIRFVSSTPSPSRDSTTGESRDPGRPLVMRAAGGAILEFDQPLEIARGAFGSLVGGVLRGEVTMISPATGPQANDGLWISTRDVQISARRLWTPHPVQFRYGPNSGQGTDLRIDWASDSSKRTGGLLPGSPLRGVQSLELTHLEKLELYSDGLGDWSPAGRPKQGTAGAPPAPERGSVPVDVSCRGPLRFDFPQQVCSLSDAVQVVWHNREGPSDRITCELLEIHFYDGQTPSPAKQRREGASQMALAPRKFVAIGYPVVIQAPSRTTEARAERVEYDFRERTFRFADKGSVDLQDANRRVQAKELEYQMGPGQRLGRLLARGPGRIWGRSGAEGASFEASWQGVVQLQPHEHNSVLSLTGGVRMAFAGMGQCSAEEVHVDLIEAERPGAAGKFDVLPTGIHALGAVRIDSPQFSGSLAEAKLTFRQLREKPAGSPSPAAAVADPVKPPPSPAAKNEPPVKLDMVADLLEAALKYGQPIQVEELTLRGRLRQPSVPARVTLPGLALEGEQLQLRQGDNVLVVAGPGTMAMSPRSPMQQGLPPLFVQWQGGMQFDGAVARFHRDITVRGDGRTKNGEMLSLFATGPSLRVTLAERIDFANPQPRTNATVREMSFDNGALLENQLSDDQGNKKFFLRMNAPTLAIDPVTGDAHASGPGWLTCVHRRGETSPQLSGNRATAAERPLEFVRIDYARELIGRIHKGEVEFRERVRCLYGPVADWNDSLQLSGNAELGEGILVLDCNQLQLADMSSPVGSFKELELQARGSASVLARSFSASGERISYSRSKDLLLLEGDGRNDAVLRLNAGAGSPPAEYRGGGIVYWPGTRQFELRDVRSLNLHDLNRLRALRRGEADPRPR